MILLDRLRAVYAEWRGCRPYRFPVCCQAHYYLDVLRDHPSAFKRGGVDFGVHNAYVPCAICIRRPWRWQRPMTLHGPAVAPRYLTWVQACAELGIPERVALRYGTR